MTDLTTSLLNKAIHNLKTVGLFPKKTLRQRHLYTINYKDTDYFYYYTTEPNHLVITFKDGTVYKPWVGPLLTTKEIKSVSKIKAKTCISSSDNSVQLHEEIINIDIQKGGSLRDLEGYLKDDNNLNTNPLYPNYKYCLDISKYGIQQYLIKNIDGRVYITFNTICNCILDSYYENNNLYTNYRPAATQILNMSSSTIKSENERTERATQISLDLIKCNFKSLLDNLKNVDLENEEINKELIKSLTAFNNSKLIQGVLDGYKLRNI